MSLTPEDIERAQELKHADNEAKLDLVRELLVELRWTPQSRRLLCTMWNMGAAEIYRMGMLAQSLILSQMTDPDELRATLIAKATFITEDALRKRRPFLDKEGNVVMAPDPDHRSGLNGLMFIAKLAGVLDGPPKDRRDDYANKSLDELIEMAKKKILPAPQPRGTTNDSQTRDIEIITAGEGPGPAGSSGGGGQRAPSSAGAAAHKERAVSVPDDSPGRDDGSRRVRGRNSRSDRDPTGQKRDRRSEGE